MITLLTILTFIWLIRKGLKADKKKAAGKKLTWLDEILTTPIKAFND